MVPPEESLFRGLDWLWGGILSILSALTAGLWSMQSSKIDQLRQDHGRELDYQRSNISTLINKIDDHARLSADRHIELLTVIHNGLSQKQDK